MCMVAWVCVYGCACVGVHVYVCVAGVCVCRLCLRLHSHECDFAWVCLQWQAPLVFVFILFVGGCRHDMYTPNGPSCAGATHALVAMSSRAGTPGRGILWLGRGKTPGQVQAGRLRGLCLQLSSGPGPEHHYDESLAGTRGAAHAILPTLPPSTASVYGGCCLLW